MMIKHYIKIHNSKRHLNTLYPAKFPIVNLHEQYLMFVYNVDNCKHWYFTERDTAAIQPSTITSIFCLLNTFTNIAKAKSP